MGVGKTFGEAFAKAQAASGVTVPQAGRVYMRVRRGDQARAVAIARQLQEKGFTIVASTVTATVLAAGNIDVLGIDDDGILEMLEKREIALVILTVDEKRSAIAASRPIRQAALKARTPICTTIAGADALLQAMPHATDGDVLSLQELHDRLLHRSGPVPEAAPGRLQPRREDVIAASVTLERRMQPRIPKVGGAPLNLFIRQPFTESNEQEQRLIADVLQVIDSANGFPYAFRYLTGAQAESGATFRKSFETSTGVPFTPKNFRDHRLTLLDQADVFINIRVGMSESSAFEMAYHLFKGRRTPMLFLVWKHAPIKTTLLRELEDLCDITYLEFEHADDLRRGIHEFFRTKPPGMSPAPGGGKAMRDMEQTDGVAV